MFGWMGCGKEKKIWERRGFGKKYHKWCKQLHLKEKGFYFTYLFFLWKNIL